MHGRLPTIRSHFQPLFQAAGNPLSLSIYFTVMVFAPSLTLSATIRAGLEKNDVPAETVDEVSSLPPTGALFAVFLGYNPMQTLLPTPVLNQLAPPLNVKTCSARPSSPAPSATRSSVHCARCSCSRRD